MSLNRRELLKVALKAGTGAAVLSGIPGPLWAGINQILPASVPEIRDTTVRELAFRAIQAATEAGASYADVRLTHTRHRAIEGKLSGTTGVSPSDAEGLVVGVRALVAGYWGFAASPIWTADEMARLGRESVSQARALGIGPAREIELARAPVPVDEHWRMPVEINPFETSHNEIFDLLASMRILAESSPGYEVMRNTAGFMVQEKAFASSDGAYCTQELYQSTGTFVLKLSKNGRSGERALTTLTTAGLGWELYTGRPIHEEVRQLMAALDDDLELPVKPVEVGRYPVVFDARTVATLADVTIGTATQLDRALGFEANASGTSYLNEPLEMLGSFELGAPALTITADRSEAGGAATVRWDDEGVRPDEFTLVRDGVLDDFLTGREGAGWLVDAQVKAGTEPRSRGCVAAPSAVEAPLIHTPNLRVEPGREALGFDELVGEIEDGFAIEEMGVDIDFQGLNGMGRGRVYEVKDGKRVALVTGAGVLFRSPELWKTLVTLGGAESMRRYGTNSTKGEPPQATYHSVSSPPALFDQVTVIDPTRKA